MCIYSRLCVTFCSPTPAHHRLHLLPSPTPTPISGYCAAGLQMRRFTPPPTPSAKLLPLPRTLSLSPPLC